MGLPSIDLAELEGRGRDAELAKLRRAAHEFGAFFLTGHGLDTAAAETVLTTAGQLFALPARELAAIDMIHSPFFRGYSAVGTELTLGRPELREQLDIAPEEAPHVRELGEPPYARLRGPNLWPAGLPALRPAVERWMEASRIAARRLMAAVLESAGLAGDTFAAGFTGTAHERVKIIRYPGADAASTRQGVGEHRDSGFLTLIVQDGNRGLEIHDGAEFVEAGAPRGACIAVLGRTLEYATNGSVRAALHRVTSPPAGGERISAAYFFNPRLDYIVDPKATPGRAPRAYGYEVLETLLRSHPHVAERYCADLLTEKSSH